MNVSAKDQFDSLVAAVEDDDRVAKLALADWFDERGANPDLAYALRWAAKHNKHPHKSSRSRVVYWDVLLAGMPKQQEKPYQLTRLLWQALKGRTGQTRRTMHRYTIISGPKNPVQLAYESLGHALSVLRKVIEI